jgi:hypothetical protein
MQTSALDQMDADTEREKQIRRVLLARKHRKVFKRPRAWETRYRVDGVCCDQDRCTSDIIKYGFIEELCRWSVVQDKWIPLGIYNKCCSCGNVFSLDGFATEQEALDAKWQGGE